MKRKVLLFAIGCICAVSALFFQSCTRESDVEEEEVDVEDYGQAIIGDWELEEYKWEDSMDYHLGGYFYTNSNYRILEEYPIFLPGPHVIEATNFETKCRISFRQDGTYVYSEGGSVSNTKEWTTIGDVLSLKGDVSWETVAHLEDNSYCIGVNSGVDSLMWRYVDTSYTREACFNTYNSNSKTIESLTRQKLTIVSEDYYGEQKTFKFKRI